MPVLLARRLAHALAVVLVALSASFALLHAAPGDPLGAMADGLPPGGAARAALRARFGLDQPLPVQYLAYLGRAVRGDLGVAISHDRPVLALLGEALPATLLLSGAGLALAVGLGLGVGTWQGWKPASRVGRAVGAALTAAYAMPEFVLAVALLFGLALRLGLFPVGGMADPLVAVIGTPAERTLDRVRHLALPALTLALGWGAAVARQHRAALLAVRDEDFVRTARAKGLAPAAVLGRHALRPALAQLASTLGLMLPVLVGGTVVVELLFAWPGMGLLLVRAIGARDYPLVAGAVIVSSAAVAAGTLLAEAATALLDPRTRRPAGDGAVER